jgi:Fur family ferric uptake transcriptional regulator
MGTTTRNELSDLLKKHKLRVTVPRIAIIEVFNSFDHALSHSDIEKHVGDSIDRVTVYRTLSSFEENGIIHKVLDDTSILKYAICSSTCSSESHVHNHVHFKCSNCGNSECLVDVKIPDFDLPPNYKLEESNVLMNGVCANCVTKN